MIGSRGLGGPAQDPGVSDTCVTCARKQTRLAAYCLSRGRSAHRSAYIRRNSEGHFLILSARFSVGHLGIISIRKSSLLLIVNSNSTIFAFFKMGSTYLLVSIL